MQETLSDPAFLLTSGFRGNFSGNSDSRKGVKKAGNIRLFGLVHAATFRAISASANAICPLDGAYGLMCSAAAFDVILERHGSSGVACGGLRLLDVFGLIVNVRQHGGAEADRGDPILEAGIAANSFAHSANLRIGFRPPDAS